MRIIEFNVFQVVVLAHAFFQCEENETLRESRLLTTGHRPLARYEIHGYGLENQIHPVEIN